MQKIPQKKTIGVLIAAVTTLSFNACGSGSGSGDVNPSDGLEVIQESGPPVTISDINLKIRAPTASAQVQADIAPSPPQSPSGNPVAQTYLAYRYSYQFGLPADKVSETSKRHISLCMQAGSDLCQVLRANENIRSEDNVSASLELRAQPDWILQFRTRLESSVKDADGKILNSGVTTEDLTRAIVDTDARLNSQKILRSRLEDLVNTDGAELSDLLSLERELARVQGTIESATTTLGVYKQRVNMSIMSINYQSNPKIVTRRSVSPVGRALRNAVHTFSSALGSVITFIAALLPWMIIIVPLFWFIRRLWRARPVRRAKGEMQIDD